MRKFVALPVMLMVIGLLACGTPVQTDPAPQAIPILKQWAGTLPVAALDTLPENQRATPLGYISEEAIFSRVWQEFSPDQPLPQVDFADSLVLFARNTRYFNTTSIVQVNLREDVLQIIAISTMTARPIQDKVGMALALIPRTTAHMIEIPQGQPLAIE